MIFKLRFQIFFADTNSSVLCKLNLFFHKSIEMSAVQKNVASIEIEITNNFFKLSSILIFFN